MVESKLSACEDQCHNYLSCFIVISKTVVHMETLFSDTNAVVTYWMNISYYLKVIIDLH